MKKVDKKKGRKNKPRRRERKKATQQLPVERERRVK